MKNLFLLVSVSVLLAACGTSVPLTEVPVTDASPKVVSGAAGAGAGSVNGQSGGLTAGDLGKSGDAATSLPTSSRLVYFDYDSYVVKPEFQSLIAANARVIKSQAGIKVQIEGHTDERGGREYNLALGQKRAEAVRDALSILGVSSSQLEAVSFGKEKPAVPGADEASYAKNRRAEIRYQ